MNNLFSSDWHLGHKNICNFDPTYGTEEERSNIIIQNMAGSVRKRDVLWCLGDICFTEERLALLDEIKCQKFLVIGNHDAQHFDSWKLYEKFDRIFGITKKYGCWLSHAPIHPTELRGKFNIHGHTHSVFMERDEFELVNGVDEYLGREKDPRYINMCVENHNYMPRDLNWIREQIEEGRD